jgi:hypothetical protein
MTADDWARIGIGVLIIGAVAWVLFVGWPGGTSDDD